MHEPLFRHAERRTKRERVVALECEIVDREYALCVHVRVLHQKRRQARVPVVCMNDVRLLHAAHALRDPHRGGGKRREAKRVVLIVAALFVLIKPVARVERVAAQQQNRHAGIGHTAAQQRRVAAGQAGERADLAQAFCLGNGVRIGGKQDGGIDAGFAQRGSIGADHIAESAGLGERDGFGGDQQNVQRQNGLSCACGTHEREAARASADPGFF